MLRELKKKDSLKKLIVIVTAIIVASVVVFAYSHKSTTKAGVSTPQTTQSSSSTASSNTASPSASPTSNPSTKPTPASTPTQACGEAAQAAPNLPAPTGDILNKGLYCQNQYISLSNDSATSSTSYYVESTCSSVANASCGIQAFQNVNSPVVVAAAQTVDSLSYTSVLDWSAKAAGLSAGVWYVRAFASKNGQTSYSAAYALKVQL